MSHPDDDVLRISELSIPLPTSGDRQFAVKDLSFSVKRGEIVCLVGESGSGKSVTASTVMRLSPLRPASGRILLNGDDVLKASARELKALRGGKMGMIFQEPMTALNPVQRVGAQVAESLVTHRWNKPGQSIKDRVVELFRDVHLPDPSSIADAYPHELSGGQRQRVMIAMALAHEPSLLIADEPTTALDVTTQAQIIHLIRELQRLRNTGVLFITHDFGVVADIADRVVVMKNGEAVEAGTKDEVLFNPQHEYTRRLLAAVPRLQPRPAVDFASAKPVVDVIGLNKTYIARSVFGPVRKVAAVDDVSFAIRRGETVGIVGESGSGKSTAARCIARFVNPNSGAIQLDGTDIALLSEAKLRPHRQKVQVIFQDPNRSLNPRRTICQSLIEGPMNFGISRAEAAAAAEGMLRTVGLGPESLQRYPHQFSGGQRQRIAIARALLLKPSLLIADEAVSALDVSVQAQVLELLENIRDEFGLAMLFITHDLRVAARMCDSIIVMQRGAIVERALSSEIFVAPKHSYTRALLEALPGQSWLGRAGASEPDQAPS